MTPQIATVARIADGDTFDLRSGTRVRLVQIDAPELGDGECYATEARRELERLVPPGTRVELRADGRLDDTDRYGRLLRYAFTAGERHVNLELVRRGAAAPFFRGGEQGVHAGELLDAAGEARREGRGMWRSCRVSWKPDRPVLTRSR